jgi:CheY-like chemotaxis protein/two-component sensor histidine kinase
MIELRKKPVALETILKAAESAVRTACADIQHALSVAIPIEPIYLEADPPRLEQVFAELLGNACKHAGTGRRIEVTIEHVAHAVAAPPAVLVRVHDDGAGIDAEQLRRIRDLFVLDPQAKSPGEQRGAPVRGLALVQQLVTLHGGSMDAFSDGPGRGAEFTVRLPIVDTAFLEPSPSPSSARSETPRRILIVDDNEDSIASMATLQKRRGHEVRTAATGPEALAVAVEFLPQVVLLDLGLPGMDGFEVARQLRAMLTTRRAFLIAMTGYAKPEDWARAREAGFDEHLVKPVDLQILRRWLADDARFRR